MTGTRGDRVHSLSPCNSLVHVVGAGSDGLGDEVPQKLKQNVILVYTI